MINKTPSHLNVLVEFFLSEKIHLAHIALEYFLSMSKNLIIIDNDVAARTFGCRWLVWYRGH